MKRTDRWKRSMLVDGAAGAAAAAKSVGVAAAHRHRHRHRSGVRRRSWACCTGSAGGPSRRGDGRRPGADPPGAAASGRLVRCLRAIWNCFVDAVVGSGGAAGCAALPGPLGGQLLQCPGPRLCVVCVDGSSAFSETGISEGCISEGCGISGAERTRFPRFESLGGGDEKRGLKLSPTSKPHLVVFGRRRLRRRQELVVRHGHHVK